MPWLLITILPPQTGFPQLLSAAVVQPRFCRQVNILFNNSVALTLSPCVFLIPFDLGTELTEYQCQSVCSFFAGETLQEEPKIRSPDSLNS